MENSQKVGFSSCERKDLFLSEGHLLLGHVQVVNLRVEFKTERFKAMIALLRVSHHAMETLLVDKVEVALLFDVLLGCLVEGVNQMRFLVGAVSGQHVKENLEVARLFKLVEDLNG